MSYQNYGIRPEFVQRVKIKMKNPVVKERVQAVLHNVNKFDLQDRTKVRKLVRASSAVLQEKLTDVQEEQIVAFVLGQRIDPKNTFHLIKLWGMFR